MAHVEKRGTKWQARYRDGAGRERTKRFDRKVDAERWLATMLADLATFVLDALADHLRRHPAETGELVLRTPDGLPVDADRFGHQWRRACRLAGVPGLGYHALRHTFASTLLSRGV